MDDRPTTTIAKRPQQLPITPNQARAAIEAARSPEDVLEVNRQLEVLERYMRQTGQWPTEINIERMRARWKLGRLLREVERMPESERRRDHVDQVYMVGLLKTLKLDRRLALQAQRIGCLPEDKIEQIFADALQNEDMLTYDRLEEIARPWWKKENREARHQDIRDRAADMAKIVNFGPFPLIYADPPWRFDTYSELGRELCPDQHYPVMTYDDIANLRPNDQDMDEVCADDAALFLWCTSSNFWLALRVMQAWGFEIKTSAVWGKDRTGTGYVFLNQHEMLLYGTRGDMPAPQWLPSSLFLAPRGRHSEKPAEVRSAIEKMYPYFGMTERLELFARGEVPGWTTWGFEA
jgi:N6-adenosine-specific RNA methylase IME4